jgi:hypothetical protein
MRRIPRAITTLLAIAVMVLLVGCGGAGTAPAPGNYDATSSDGLWTFHFSVNQDVSGVASFTEDAPKSGFACGSSVPLNSDVPSASFTPRSPWPITGGHFTIDTTSVAPGAAVTIVGQVQSGGKASGTWSFHDCTSTGSWTATSTQ